MNSFKTKYLKIISVDVNSIITNNRRSDLTKFVADYNPDIVLIGETKLNPKYKIEFKDYDVYRNDRPNATQGGGTAILIKKPIQYQKIEMTHI